MYVHCQCNFSACNFSAIPGLRNPPGLSALALANLAEVVSRVTYSSGTKKGMDFPGRPLIPFTHTQFVL